MKQTIKLNVPVQVEGEQVTEITLSEPTVGDLRAMDQASGDVGRAAALIGSLAGWPPSSVNAISSGDFTAICEVMSGFFGGVPPTGGN